MTEHLDFRLPEEISRPQPPGKGHGFHSLLLAITLVAVIAFGVMSLKRGKLPSSSGEGPGAEQERALAAKLQDRGLKVSAAEAWLRYIFAAKLEPEERARTYYQVGKLYQDAGDFEKALVSYYRSEAAAKMEDVQLELSRRKRECFRRLGNIAGLNRELEAMTSLAPPEAPKEGGGEVVAEIGPTKIRMEELNRRIDQLVDLQLKQYASFMPREELAKQKERIVDQFQGREAKFQVLQDMVAKEVLLREAMKRGLDKKRENDEAIEEFRRSLFASKVLDDEISQKVNITESDLRDYYQAHDQEFKEKAKVEISLIVTAKREDAESVLQKLKDGKSFEECAKEFSVDEATKENGGQVEGEIEKGGRIPGIGDNIDVHAHLFALKENEVSYKPLEVGDKFYIFKVRKLIPERVKPFEEVEAEVRRRKTQEKIEEVRESLIQRLQSEHNVIIHRSRFLPEKPEEQEKPKEDKKQGASSARPGTI